MDGSQAKEAAGDALSFDEIGEDCVNLEHKIFTVSDDGHFRMSNAGDTPVYVMKYGEDTVSLPFAGLIDEFGIEPASEDFRNLGIIEEALRFVKVIRVGDPIPREVLTGEASWQVTETHRQIAYGRLTMQLVAWLTKDENVPTGGRDLLMALEDPETSERINSAMDEAANELGYGAGARDKVVGDIEKMADELAYIEFLRDVYASVKGANQKVLILKTKYASEQTAMDTIVPVLEFLDAAIEQFAEKFGEVDEMSRDIIDSLKSIVTQARIIQEVRNDLYCRLNAWDEILPQWDAIEARRSAAVENLLRETYRFLAPRYLKADEWKLISQILDEKSKGAGLMEWTLNDS